MFPAEMTVWLECSKIISTESDDVEIMLVTVKKIMHKIILYDGDSDGIIYVCFMWNINIDIYLLGYAATDGSRIIHKYIYRHFLKVSFCVWQWKAQWVVSENAYSFRLESHWLYHSSQSKRDLPQNRSFKIFSLLMHFSQNTHYYHTYKFGCDFSFRVYEISSKSWPCSICICIMHTKWWSKICFPLKHLQKWLSNPYFNIF